MRIIFEMGYLCRGWEMLAINNDHPHLGRANPHLGRVNLISGRVSPFLPIQDTHLISIIALPRQSRIELVGRTDRIVAQQSVIIIT